MNPTEFDKFAAQYQATLARGVALSGESPDYFAEYKVRDVVALISSTLEFDHRFSVLDFGAGTGSSVPHFRRWAPQAEVICVDVSERSLEVGQGQYGGLASFVAFDGHRLPFADRSFDCVMASCVFHHIPADAHVTLIAEIRRVLAPGGRLVIFEHNPFNPLTVRVVRDCPFDENAVLIPASLMQRRIRQAGFKQAKVRYRVFFPHMLRRLRPLERALTWLPMGAQYSVEAPR